MNREAPRTVHGQRDVTVQFATEAAPDSALIRWFSHSRFSHIDFVLPSGSLYGARRDGGLQIRAADYAKFSSVKRIRIRTDKANAIYNAALSQEGKPYDMAAIFAFGAPFLFPRRNWRNPDRWICSEIGAWAFERGKFFHQTVALPVRRVTPGDLDLLLSPFAEVLSDWSGVAPPNMTRMRIAL